MIKNNLTHYYKQHKWLRVFSQLLLFLLIVIVVRTWQSRDYIEGAAPIIVGTTLNAQVIDLRTPRSQPLLVHFWAVWCRICQFENPTIARLAENYSVISIASWSEGEAQVREYLKQQNLNFPVIVDEDGEWAKVYGVRAVPTSFIVDTNGDIRFIETGYTSEWGLRLRLWWAE